MSRVYWDTMLFVYLLEEHPLHSARVREIATGMDERHDVLCTSVFTVGEVLVGPYKGRALEVARRTQEFFRSPLVELLPFTSDAAELYARVRAEHGIPPADAIHLACAARAGVDLFLTNDRRLRGLRIPGIQFIAGMDVSLY